ncbi:unnamed protein product [Scytosiphon promiscuus]
MHGLLQKVLEDTQNVSVPWVISSSDLIPPSTFLVAPAPDPNSSSSFSNRSASHRGGGARSPAPASHLAPPTLKGASGPLPSELAMPGRWFARTVGEEAILLTFLPALDVWRKEVSARLERRRAQREAGEERARKTKGASGGGRRWSGDFGLPIEPQSARLRDIRRILLAHIPLSHHRAMAFKPARRIGWGDDPRSGHVGTKARSYQGLVNLEHRRAFLRVVYATLREGRVLCSGDLAFALSGCDETEREVRARFSFRRCHLTFGSCAAIPLLEPGGVPQPLRLCRAACDVEFTRVLARYLRRVPGTMYYIYWGREDERPGVVDGQQRRQADINAGSPAAAPAAAAAAGSASGTMTPPQPQSTTVRDATAWATAGHLASPPYGANFDHAAGWASSHVGGSTVGVENASSALGTPQQQYRGSSLSAAADTSTSGAAAAAAAAAASCTPVPCPLFARFEVVHDGAVPIDGEDEVAGTEGVGQGNGSDGSDVGRVAQGDARKPPPADAHRATLSTQATRCLTR